MPIERIVDSHVHLWDPGKYRIPWLDGIPELNKVVDLNTYAQAHAGIDVEGLVYLQVEVAPPYALLEAREIADLSLSHPTIAGIVPWAPLEYGERCRLFLEELTSISPKIKGVRRIVQDEADPEFCLQDDFVRGNQLLAEFGLSSDLCCNYRQLAANVELVKRCPDTLFIMDHIAKPAIREGMLQPWADQMSALATNPNVYCKISGATTEADFDNWTVDDIAPFINHALSAFGEDRVMFGSDWPVVTRAATYQQWVEALDELTADLSREARVKLWRTNAIKAYRLDLLH